MLHNEDDLVVVVWANSANVTNGRPFETITKSNSRNPTAWSLSYLQEKYKGLLPQAHVVFSEEDLESWMRPPLLATSSRESPLLVPVRFARSVLGWTAFDAWEDDK
jgi:hypothetical protein